MEFVKKIIEGDCLTVLPLFPDQSIDMILCDLSYAMTQNKWDSLINLEQLCDAEWTAHNIINI